jgi:hypothetical protein
MYARAIRRSSLLVVPLVVVVTLGHASCSSGSSPPGTSAAPACGARVPCPPDETFDESLCRCVGRAPERSVDAGTTDAATAHAKLESCLLGFHRDPQTGGCVRNGEFTSTTAVDVDAARCPAFMPCGPWAHFDQGTCSCAFDTDAGQADAAPVCPNRMPCPAGAHWSQQNCRCGFETDASDAAACPSTMPCAPGATWDQQECRCVTDGG